MTFNFLERLSPLLRAFLYATINLSFTSYKLDDMFKVLGVCVYVLVPTETRKRVVDLLELKLQVVLKNLIWLV